MSEEEEEEDKEEEEKAMLADPCRNNWVLGRCPLVRGTEWVPEEPTSTQPVVVTLTKCGLFPPQQGCRITNEIMEHML